MTLAEKIKAQREKWGWSQSDLARATGIPQPTIWRLERGSIEHPKADTLISLANAFKVPIDYLVQDDYEMLPEDMIRTDRDLRETVQAYVALSEENRRMVRNLTQYLTSGATRREQRRYVSIVVKPRRVRKE